MSTGQRHLSACLCADSELQLLRELVDAGYDQVLASRIVWDPTHPHALGAMRNGPTWRPSPPPARAAITTPMVAPMVAPPRLRRSALVELALSLGREIRRAGLGSRRATATAPLQPQQGRATRC